MHKTFITNIIFFLISWIIGKYKLPYIFLIFLFYKFNSLIQNYEKINFLKYKINQEKLFFQNDKYMWFNIIFRKFWLNYEKDLSTLIAKAINDVNLQFISKFEIEKITLGKNSPYIKSIQNIYSIENKIIVYLDFGFSSPDLQFIIYAIISKIKISLSVEQLYMSGKMKMEIEFFDQEPYIKTILFSLIEKPDIILDVIQLIGKINLINIPILSQIIQNSIESEINKIIYPNGFILDVQSNKTSVIII